MFGYSPEEILMKAVMNAIPQVSVER